MISEDVAAAFPAICGGHEGITRGVRVQAVESWGNLGRECFSEEKNGTDLICINRL